MKNIYLKGFRDGCVVDRRVELCLYIFQDVEKIKARNFNSFYYLGLN